MRVLCAWCRTVMQRGDGPDDPRVSHGLCSTCEAAPESYRAKRAAMWDRLSFEYEPQFGIPSGVGPAEWYSVEDERAC